MCIIVEMAIKLIIKRLTLGEYKEPVADQMRFPNKDVGCSAKPEGDGCQTLIFV